MNLANLLTSIRLVLSPVFFVVAYLPYWAGHRFALPTTIVLWVLFFVMETSDLLDGIVARRRGIVSDVGKVLDPFADVVGHLTFFLIFAAFSIIPIWMFLLLMYREIGIIFVRILMIRENIALAARRGGKIKTALYACGSVLGLLMLGHIRLGNLHRLMPMLPWVTMLVFLLAIVMAWGSFFDYLIVLRRQMRTRSDT